MQIKRLNTDLAVSPQIDPAEVETLAALGFRSIISNRPEHEAADQPAWTDIKAAATGRGMEAVHIPVVANQISGVDVEKFRVALERLPKPIAAFCRTGTRSTLLWALTNPDALTADERIRAAAAQGYDLSAFRSLLDSADEGTLKNA